MSAKYSSGLRSQTFRLAAGSGSVTYIYLPTSLTPINSFQLHATTAITGTWAVQTSNMTCGDVGDRGSPAGPDGPPSGSNSYWYTDHALTGTIDTGADSTPVLLQYGNIGSRFARLRLTNSVAVAATGTISSHGKE